MVRTAIKSVHNESVRDMMKTKHLANNKKGKPNNTEYAPHIKFA